MQFFIIQIEIAVRKGDSSETHNSNEEEAELSYLKDVAMGKATELEQFIEENDKVDLKNIVIFR